MTQLAVSVVVANAAGLSAAKSDTTSVAATSWPDATNTGVPPGTILTDSGAITTTTRDGQIISAKNITGPITVNHNDVVIEKCKIVTGAYFPIRILPGNTGCIIRDCEIDNLGTDGSCAINGCATVLRCNIHDTENGFNWDGTGNAPTLIQDCYIHDLRAGGSPHYDGIQIDSGVNITIRHNTVINDHGGVSAIMIDNYFGKVDNVLVEDCRLVGGGFTVYCSAQFNSHPVTNVRFINNQMGKGGYGYKAFTKTDPVWQGNVDAVTGRRI
jgi:parallel beta helix pectate lyase-like protein